MNLRLKYKFIKLLEENMVGKLLDPDTGNDFFGLNTQKPRQQKQK